MQKINNDRIKFILENILPKCSVRIFPAPNTALSTTGPYSHKNEPVASFLLTVYSSSLVWWIKVATNLGKCKKYKRSYTPYVVTNCFYRYRGKKRKKERNKELRDAMEDVFPFGLLILQNHEFTRYITQIICLYYSLEQPLNVSQLSFCL
jgi:hypothetical protein